MVLVKAYNNYSNTEVKVAARSSVIDPSASLLRQHHTFEKSAVRGDARLKMAQNPTKMRLDAMKAKYLFKISCVNKGKTQRTNSCHHDGHVLPS